MYVYLVSQLLLGLISMSLNSIVFSFYWGHVSGKFLYHFFVYSCFEVLDPDLLSLVLILLLTGPQFYEI